MIDRDFERRLENWGEYFLPSRGGTGEKSPTAIVCERLAIAAGKQPKDGYRELFAQIEVDEIDAQTIEWCWSRSAYRMDAKLRGILKAHYVFTDDKRKTCRVLQITFRRYDATLEEAVNAFQKCVELFETMGDNSAKIVRLPAHAE